MIRTWFYILLGLVSFSAFGQGEVRHFDTLQQLLNWNPILSATGTRTVYEVSRRATNSSWGAPRIAVWTAATNLAPNGTNVFPSPYSGRWVFWDKDDPIQKAQWYGLTNNWSLDHLGNLSLGSTNVAGYLAFLNALLEGKADSQSLGDYSLLGHDHPVSDISDSTPISRAIVQETTPAGIRAILLLGGAATMDVGTTSNEVASGDHNHDGVYDAIGTALQLVTEHEGKTNPHPIYILSNSGSGTNVSIVGGVLSGAITLSLSGGDLNSGGSHRIMVRDTVSGELRTMDLAYFRGWMDLHGSNIVDAGDTGVQLLQSAARTNALDALGTGRVGSSLFLRSDGTWTSIVLTNSVTNSLPEAPIDGAAYARKNGGWTGLAISDVTGLSSFGQTWVAIVSDTNAVSALRLVGTNAFILDSQAKYNVRVSSSGSGTPRHRLNVLPGTAISATAVDDAADDESELTIGVTNFLSTYITDSGSVGRSVLVSTTQADGRTALGLGTMSTRDAPASGNASLTQGVLGSDTRLTNSRVPSAHQHSLNDIPNIGTGNVIGRKGASPGVAEQITPAELAAILINAGLSTGTVKSVSLSMPGIFSVSGSPVTNQGTIAVATVAQSANTVYAGPTSGSSATPGFRPLVLTDLPAGAWTVNTDGPGSGSDADLLDGQQGSYYLSRNNHTGTQPWNTIVSTPVTVAGYGITNAADLAAFRAHTNASVSDESHVHGIGLVGGLVAQTDTYPELWDVLQIQGGAFLFPPVPGSNAVVDPSHGTGVEAEIVVASDTRLTNSRPPTAHGHTASSITNVSADVVLGRRSTTGNAEEIPFSFLATNLYALAGGSTGTVRSVGLSLSGSPINNLMSVTGSPVTNSGSFSLFLQTQTQKRFFASPTVAAFGGSPSFREIVEGDLPSTLWTANNDGTGSGLDSDLLDGSDSLFYLSRANHTGTQPWSTISSTPTTLSGYGITDAATAAALAAHTNLTTGAHGMTSFGASLVDDANSSAARTTLGLGTSATLNVAASGNAASGEVVKGNDTRLTDSRTPSSHTHPVSELSDAGTFGRLLTQAAVKTNALNLLGSGGASGLILGWDGWTTPPSAGASTSGITEAPTNGLLFGRKNAGWTQVSMSDIAGMSVGLSVPGPFSVSGSPVTSSGTLAVSVSNQTQKTFWAGPVSGSDAAPAFRVLQDTDLPNTYWYAGNDGSGSGLDADLLDAQSGAYYLARGNHTGTQDWTTITGTPTTKAGYGITDVLGLSGGTLTGNLTAPTVIVTNAIRILTDTRNETNFPPITGLSSQSGPGSGNTGYDWTYPYGTKLSLYNGSSRGWEIQNTTYPNGSLAFRVADTSSWLPSWKVLLDSTNFTAYSPTLTGGGAAGTWGISIGGNAATATFATNVNWSGVASTPTTLSGYGITDAATAAALAAHTNLTSGAHGISSYGSTLVATTNDAAARTVLGLGTAAVKDAPASGNASSGQVVLGNDTRLTDSRTPTSHTHGTTEIVGVASKTVLGRLSSGTGTAEQIPYTNFVNDLRTYGGLTNNGTVTSVALESSPIFNVSGSPITGAGTIYLYLASQPANVIFAGPVSGGAADPTFRAMTLSDLPGGTWTSANDGSGSGLDADLLDGLDSTSLLYRGNHTGLQLWTTITNTPTTLSGYGITDGISLAQFQGHTNATVGAHGISTYGLTLAGAASASAARTSLGLGTGALLDVPASAGAAATSIQLVRGDDPRMTDARTPLSHDHDGRYDLSGTASNSMAAHVGAGNPHSQYVLASGGSASSLSISGNSSLSGNLTLSLSDTANTASHRFIIRDAVDGLAKYATIPWAKGMLDYHIADIVDSGSVGRSLVQASTLGTALDVLGTGRTGGTALFLREDGTWSTPPSGGSGTNGITDAPTNGVAYARKDGAWTGLNITDVSGLATFGRTWITSIPDSSSAIGTLGLTGGGAVTIDSPAKLAVRANSSGSGAARHRINFISGSVNASVSDDGVSDEADVTLNVGDGYRGDVVVSGGGTVFTITNGAVSPSKMSSIGSSTLLGRGSSGGTGIPQAIFPGTGLTMSGTSLNVDPSTFISGQILYVSSIDTELAAGALVDEAWHNILGAARSGTSKVIPAYAIPVGGTVKVELYGEYGATDSNTTGMGRLRVTLGNNWYGIMQFSNENSDTSPNGSPWNATILVTFKNGNAVKASGSWNYSTFSGPSTGGGTAYMARMVSVGTVDPTVSNTIGAEFYGTDAEAGNQFNQFSCNQAIVTRY